MKHPIARVTSGARSFVITVVLVSCCFVALATSCTQTTAPAPIDPTLIARGKDIFRFDTFGDETFWTDTLRIHEVISAAVDPTCV